MFPTFVALALSSVILAIPTPVSAIFGGVPASIKDHPYQISIEHHGRDKCGGSILSTTFVVTAASCIKGVPLQSLRVHTGPYSFNHTHYHHIDQVFVHPNFTMVKYTIPSYDVALLHLEEPIVFDDTSQPIKMFNDIEEIESGFLANVTGWSRMVKIPVVMELRAANVTINDEKTCNYVYAPLNFSPNSHICAGRWGEVKDPSGPCTRDEGNPLVVDGRLAGVVTLSTCGQPFEPAVYTKIAQVRKWIDQHVQL